MVKVLDRVPGEKELSKLRHAFTPLYSLSVALYHCLELAAETDPFSLELIFVWVFYRSNKKRSKGILPLPFCLTQGLLQGMFPPTLVRAGLFKRVY